MYRMDGIICIPCRRKMEMIFKITVFDLLYKKFDRMILMNSPVDIVFVYFFAMTKPPAAVYSATRGSLGHCLFFVE